MFVGLVRLKSAGQTSRLETQELLKHQDKRIVRDKSQIWVEEPSEKAKIKIKTKMEPEDVT